MTMQYDFSRAKPRITDRARLLQIVEDLRRHGVEGEALETEIVRLAIVDLDQLQEVMRAA
jgi:hypothetical protein